MANEVTIVQYDTTQAIQALDNLDRSVQDSAKTAEQSFKKSEAASKKFDNALSVLSPRANAMVGNFKKLIGAAGPAGIAIGTAAVAVGSLVANAVDLPRLLRDTSDALDEVHKGMDRLTDLQNQQIDLQVTIDTQEIKQRIKGLQDEILNITESRVVLGEDQDIAQERLSIQKDLFTKMEALARQSAQKRQAIERNVADLRQKQFERGIDKLDPGIQIKKLLDRAAQQRERGDFGGAERSLDRAASVQEQSGSRFGRRQLVEEENRLIQAMEKSAQAIGLAEKAQVSAAAAAQRNIATLQNEVKLLTQANDQLKARQKLLGVQVAREGKAAQDVTEEGDRTKAINERTTALQKLLDLQKAERSGFEKLTDLGRAGLSALGGGAGQGQQQAALIKQAQDAANQAVQQFQQGTVTGDKEALNNLTQIEQILTRLRKDGVQGALEFNVGNLERFLAAAKELRDATREFIGAEGGAGRIGPRPTTNVPATTPQRVLPVDPKTGAPSTAAPSVINVNANVKGGIIDAEVTRTIVDLIRRELRRGTGPGTR